MSIIISSNKKINFYSFHINIMESVNSIQSNEKLSNLMDKINETCDALISALEVNAESVGAYGGWVAHQINTEYVDLLIKNILKIKYHLIRLEKELNNGLISSKEELKCIVEWLLNTIDTIDTVCVNDGYLRNQFSFATDELKDLIRKMLDEITISIYA